MKRTSRKAKMKNRQAICKAIGGEACGCPALRVLLRTWGWKKSQGCTKGRFVLHPAKLPFPLMCPEAASGLQLPARVYASPIQSLL